MKDEENIIRKLEDFACDNNENNRVVSVVIDRYLDKKTQPNYLTTNIVIRALDDNVAHSLDDQKWRDGNLVDYLERELNEVNSCD